MTDLDGPAATERAFPPVSADRALRPDELGGTAQLSDGPLVISIASGSQDALAEAYSRHGTSVQRVAQRMCGDRAADVTQDVFLGLWRRPERFDPARGTLGAFLRVQAHGRAVDLLRSDGARRTREITDHRHYQKPSGDGRIHWASTETAPDAPGHIEGALAAAARAVKTITAERSASYEATSPLQGDQ